MTLALIGIILLQRGSDDDYGGSSTSGRGGKNGLTTATSIFGGIFFVNCLSLAILISREAKLHAVKKEDIQKTMPQDMSKTPGIKNLPNINESKKSPVTPEVVSKVAPSVSVVKIPNAQPATTIQKTPPSSSLIKESTLNNTPKVTEVQKLSNTIPSSSSEIKKPAQKDNAQKNINDNKNPQDEDDDDDQE